MENKTLELGIEVIYKNRALFEEYTRNNQKLQAVKDLKSLAGIGLKEAKDVLDLYWDGKLPYFTKEMRIKKLERLAKMPLIEEIIPKLRNLTDEKLTNILLTLSVDELFSLEEKLDTL